jgi:hypothetical protein
VGVNGFDCGPCGPGDGDGVPGDGDTGVDRMPGLGVVFFPGGLGDFFAANVSLVSFCGRALVSRMLSTMLEPSAKKARCATVSPTADEIARCTASCISGFSPAVFLACVSTFTSNSRSWALRIRSSCVNVAEKESRICFGVMRDTPPRIRRTTRFLGTLLRGKQKNHIPTGC